MPGSTKLHSMKMEKQKFGIGVTLTTTALVIAITIISIASPRVVVSSSEPEWSRDTKLQVDTVYVLSGEDDNTEDNSTPVVANIYLTNENWKDSGDVKIVAYLLRRNPDIGIGNESTLVGVIEGGVTKEIGVRLVIPDFTTSYDIDFLIFENDLLVLRGQGNIQIYKSFELGCPAVFWPANTSNSTIILNLRRFFDI